MNEGLKKFEELLKTDAAFQEKLKAAMENYKGEKTEQAVFEDVLLPLAKEYGITATLAEVKEYINNVSGEDRELSEDEVNQVAGGGKDFGATACLGWGIGLGDSGSGTCVVLGAGDGAGACAGSGT